MIDGVLSHSTNIFFGESQFPRLGVILKEYGERILVVTGGQSYTSSRAKELIEPLLASVELIQTTLNGIPPDPTADWVYEGVALCRKGGIQAILAVGGGSVIDVAKAIGIAAVDDDGDFFDFFLRTRVPRGSLPVGCVLTLAGAGSESSDGCVILKGHQKYSAGAPFMRPKFAFINTELMLSVEEKLLRYGVADSLSHVLERYFTAVNNVATTSYISVALMKSIMSLSRDVLLKPADKAVRSDLVWAQKLAHDETAGFGRKGDWATHTLAHEIAVLSHAAHGEILSILFPAWLRFVHPLRSELFAFLDKELLDQSEPPKYKSAIEKIVDFYSMICPTRRSLSELGIQEKDIALIVERATMTTASGTIGNLIRLEPHQIEGILRDAL
jgi:alcohol dehydrogenase YqhD (iron-dependent ADH family)